MSKQEDKTMDSCKSPGEKTDSVEAVDWRGKWRSLWRMKLYHYGAKQDKQWLHTTTKQTKKTALLDPHYTSFYPHCQPPAFKMRRSDWLRMNCHMMRFTALMSLVKTTAPCDIDRHGYPTENMTAADHPLYPYNFLNRTHKMAWHHTKHCGHGSRECWIFPGDLRCGIRYPTMLTLI